MNDKPSKAKVSNQPVKSSAVGTRRPPSIQVAPPIAEQLLNLRPLLESIREEISAHHLETAGDGHETLSPTKVFEAVESCAEQIRVLNQKIEELQARNAELLNFAQVNNLFPTGPFLTRFYTDHPREKQELAAYVVKKYFVERGTRQRCFIQASTTALHLGYCLAADVFVPSQSLIYTNSAVAHLPLLYERSAGKILVWPFCGQTFDPVCAGWLIPPHDPAWNSLSALFDGTRSAEPLKTAFIMPIAITPEGLFFERNDTAMFADAIAMAEEVVVLATSDRVFADRSQFSVTRSYTPALGNVLVQQADKITYVIAGPAAPQPDIAKQLRQRVGKVLWQSDSGWSEVQ